MKESETLTSILNKLHAMHAIGFVTFAQVAKMTDCYRQDVSNWVLQRSNAPNGHTAIKIRNSVTQLTLRMAIGSQKHFQAQYRAAYQAACKKFPVDGRN